MGPAVAIVGAVAGLAGTFMQMQAANEQADIAQKQLAVDKKRADVKYRRDKRERIREVIIAQAQQQEQATAQGAGFSSAQAGGEAGIISQGYRNVQALNVDKKLNNKSFNLAGQMIDAQRFENFGAGVNALGGGLAPFADMKIFAV